MANLFAIHSVGSSLATYLNKIYPSTLRIDHPCTFQILSSAEINEPIDADPDAVASLFLYRVTMNEHLRNASRANAGSGRNVPLSIDLHYLLTVWTKSALSEQAILAWAMLQLHMHPVLDRSALSPEAGWSAGDVIQLIPAELSNEELFRIWDALAPPYRLSVSYIARVVQIDAEPIADGLPVVASRFSMTDREAEP